MYWPFTSLPRFLSPLTNWRDILFIAHMRSIRRSRLLWLALFAGIGPMSPEARAIVTYGGTGTNTGTVPYEIGSYSLDNYEGSFDTAAPNSGYTGTPITSTMMLTASHIFPATTNVPFFYNNGTGTTTSYALEVVASLDDLAAWQVEPSQPSFSLVAPIYTGSSELGSTVVDLGRGYARGPATTGGWTWGGGQGPLSWGTNTVSAVPTDAQLATGGGPFGGDFLQTDFDNNSSNPNESMVTPFDSGGGVFVDVNGTYELDGVNSFFGVRIPSGGTDYAYEVTDANGNEIGATLDDTKGYYILDGYNSQNQPVVTPITTDTPESSFATRISSKQNFVGLVDGTIPASQAASHPINDDGLLSIYSNLTTGAITGGAQISIGPDENATLRIAAGSATSAITSLAISSGSTLDITNNKLTIAYGEPANDPISSIAAWIVSGYAHGSWTGLGITSTTAQTNAGSYGIGYADSADPGNPAGLAADTVEIMYTLLGDANLDGKVNGIDFNLMATNLNKTVTDGWDEGDFNYDGKVNGNDFVLLAENFNQFASQSGVSAADLAALEDFSTVNGLATSLPEPALAGIMLLAGLGVLSRRRSHR